VTDPTAQSVPPAAAHDLVVHIARLAAALREAGVRVALGDEIDAARALLRIDLGDPDEVRRALRCTLRIRPPDLAAFERAFARTWLGREPERPPPPAARRQGPGLPLPAALAGLRAALAGDAGGEVPDGDQPGASAEALFRRKPFERCDDRDLAAMEPLIERLARRLATRRSRRWIPVHGAGRADLRRSLRRAVATGGELVSLAHRARPIETARLVLLCDTSGSMEAHTRFLLAFARALRRASGRTEVFAFNTELVRVTAWMRLGRLAVLEARLREADGLDRGDPAVLGAAMRRIRARARRVLWLNPLAGDPRFEPTAGGMAAALPHIDLLAPVHDLASLEKLLPHLRM